ncbi:MAG TPA: GlxA family transcriptional regulator [Rhizomicrobium sp.]|nr:GlxA family transcriptional regulator [Rhizomicrobium sp.]
MASSGVRHIGLLGFDGVAAIDLVGVLDAFYIAGGNDWRTPSERYATSVIGLSREPFRAESGLQFVPHMMLDDVPPFDTIVVPGGPGLREEKTNAMVAAWLRSRADTRRIVTVCTGLYGLAASGLLDGRRATTHWEHTAHAQTRFPKVRIEPDAIFVRDGKFYSSAGMTAGIDLALALIEEDHGPALALSTARQLVVYMKRSGGQLQYSEPLRFQAQAGDRLNALVAKIVGNLAGDWSVEEMAAQTGLSSRQFARRFRDAFGVTPALYIERLRLDEARLRLASGREKIATIAHSTGFGSDDAFRRAFERRFGVSPSTYRGRFTEISSEEQHHDTTTTA